MTWQLSPAIYLLNEIGVATSNPLHSLRRKMKKISLWLTSIAMEVSHRDIFFIFRLRLCKGFDVATPISFNR